MSSTESAAAGEAGPRNRRARQLLGASLALTLIGSVGASLFKTGFGQTDVIGFRIPTQDGQWVSADL
jgi:hypothetical protein